MPTTPAFERMPRGASLRTLSNDFFVNLLDMGVQWTATSGDAETFEGRDSATGEVKGTGTRADLVLGSNSEFHAVAGVYAGDDAKEKFVRDFVGRGTRSCTSTGTTWHDSSLNSA